MFEEYKRVLVLLVAINTKNIFEIRERNRICKHISAGCLSFLFLTSPTPKTSVEGSVQPDKEEESGKLKGVAIFLWEDVFQMDVSQLCVL